MAYLTSEILHRSRGILRLKSFVWMSKPIRIYPNVPWNTSYMLIICSNLFLEQCVHRSCIVLCWFCEWIKWRRLCNSGLCAEFERGTWHVVIHEHPSWTLHVQPSTIHHLPFSLQLEFSWKAAQKENNHHKFLGFNHGDVCVRGRKAPVTIQNLPTPSDQWVALAQSPCTLRQRQSSRVKQATGSRLPAK
jgi:hypothetical protein